jgi:hypothetical protein
VDKKCNNKEVTLFHDFLLRRKHGHRMKRRYVKKVYKAIEKKWHSLPYTIQDTCLIYQANTFILEADINEIKKFFRQTKLPLSSNEKKNGRDQIYAKFKKNLYKSFFRESIEDYFERAFQQLSLSIYAAPTVLPLKHALLDYDIVTVIYFANRSLHKNKWIKLFKKHSLQTYTACLINLYTFSISENVEKTLHKQPQLSSHKKDIKSIKKELDQLKQRERILEKTERNLLKEKKKLKNEINQLKQFNEKYQAQLEKLKIESDETLTQIIHENEEQLMKEKRQSANEIQALKNKLEEDNNYYNEQIMKLLQQLDNAYKFQDENLNNTEGEIPLDLCGKKVAFIGGNQSNNYMSKVKEYNGKLTFVPVDDFKLIPGAISNCDVVFFLTDVAGHKHFNCIRKETKRTGTPLRFINSRGLTSFERELKKYIVEDKSEKVAGSK